MGMCPQTMLPLLGSSFIWLLYSQLLCPSSISVPVSLSVRPVIHLSVRWSERGRFNKCIKLFSSINSFTLGFTDCISALMSSLCCEMFSSVKKKRTLIFSKGTKRVTLTFQADGGRWERLSYVLCQHYTSQFATRVKETVWKLEQPIRCTEWDLFVYRKAEMQCLAGQTENWQPFHRRG